MGNSHELPELHKVFHLRGLDSVMIGVGRSYLEDFSMARIWIFVARLQPSSISHDSHHE